ncbi:MAG: hypothetical protein Q8J69_07690 [Sphingobacteriaceae bacterium]|nr:hypothetical protein [Sphingobacteriaceae bacterium]
MNKFSEGQKVTYEGKETHIEQIYADGSCKIANPDWDWDEEAECVSEGVEYDVQYWINVNLAELSAL